MATRWISASRVARLLGDTDWASPAYQDLAERLRLLIVDGRIGHGSRLPSERDLAGELGLSRSTVAAGYAELRDRGYAEARRGSGNYAIAGAAGSAGLLGTEGPTDGLIEFNRAAPQATPGLLIAYERTVGELPGLLGSTGYEPQGVPALREAIADRFAQRGLPTDPDQILVTSGALSALAVLARCLLSRGDRVLVDAPTYPNAMDAFRQHGARLVAQPVGADGWDPEATELLVRQTSPRLAYLVPEFHNPTGRLMPEPTRAALRDVFRTQRVTMIIDETMVELALDDPAAMPPPLAAGAADAITVGSASKAFWGGLRVGWIRAPRSLIRPLVQSRVALDLGTAPLEQLVTAGLLRDASTLLELQRERLIEQRDRLIAELAERLPGWTCERPAGGLSLWITLPREVSSRLAGNADRYGLQLTPGGQFFPDGGGERMLRLPYTLPIETLTVAVDRLTELWADVASRPVSPGRLSLTA